jgi:Alginate O-acetyl transferase AlgF
MLTTNIREVEVAMKIIKTMSAILFLFVTQLSAVKAQEAGLYEAPPPEGTSYVRFLNRSKLQEPVVKLSGTAYSIGSKVLTDYSYIKEGSYDADFNTKMLTLALVAGKFYTVIVGDESATAKPIAVVEDKVISDTTHAGLYFYNYTDQSLDLVANVNGKSGAVFKGTASTSVEFKEVKPFEVAFDVQAEGKTVGSVPQVSFPRGSGVSIVVTKSDTGIVVDAINNTVAK